MKMMYNSVRGDCMQLDVFMDESSRTGQQRFNNDHWNFNNQPFFGLGALYIPTPNVDHLAVLLKECIDKEKLQGEFKWSNKQARNRVMKLFPILEAIIDENKAKVYFEIESKKFTIAKNIVEYCVYPYYLSHYPINTPEHRFEALNKRAFANLIMQKLSDSMLWEFCDFFDSDTPNTSELKRLISLLSQTINSNNISRACNKVISFIESFESGREHIAKRHLFPVPDTIIANHETKQLTIDAHSDCFGHLLSLAPQFFPEYTNIRCLHDEQTQWEPALRETIDRINNECILNNGYIYSLDFISGFNIIVNCVDYMMGYINQCLLDNINKNKSIPDNVYQFCQSHLHIVAGIDIEERLVKDDAIPFVRKLSEWYAN